MDGGSVRNTGVNTAPGREAAGPRPVATDPDSQRALQELRNRDREVRAHEQAHARVGGPYASSPSYTLEIGQDGRAYAVGGEVRIDTASVPDDPQATVEKMEQVARAAMAPADPSPRDMAVAQEARGQAARARAEMARDETGAGPVRAFAEVEAMDDSGLMRQGGRLDLFV